MPNNVGGFMGGWMEGKEFLQNQQINDLNIRNAEAKYQADMAELASKQEMARIAQGMLAQQDHEGEDVPEHLLHSSYVLGDAAIQAGLPEQAMEYYAKAGGVVKDVAVTRLRASNTHLKNLEILRQDLATVQDDASWKGLWTRYSLENPTADPKMTAMVQDHLGKPYDPKYVEFLRTAADTQLQKAQAQASLASAALSREKVKTEQFRREEYLPALADAATARADKLRKAGGVDSRLKPAQVQVGADKVSSLYNVETPIARNLGRELIRRALEIQDESDLSQPMAINQAAAEMEAAGRFAGLGKRRPGAGSVDRPLAIPEDKSFKPGSWYVGDEGSKLAGQKVFFNGQDFLTEEEMSARAGEDIGAFSADDEAEADDNIDDEEAE